MGIVQENGAALRDSVRLKRLALSEDARLQIARLLIEGLLEIRKREEAKIKPTTATTTEWKMSTNLILIDDHEKAAAL